MKLELKHLVGYLPYEVNYTNKYSQEKNIYSFLDSKNILEFIKFDCNHCILLRPLSELTKEIEVNGEKFVPHLELGGRPNLKDYDFVYFKKNIENLSFGLIQQLLEWHFDIYGLIENNLAIDINTLNNDH